MVKNNHTPHVDSTPAYLKPGTAVLLVVPILVLATWLFFDALILGKPIIHGDSIAHGLSVLNLHADVLAGKSSALWSEKIFGGHPVFAESQFAFLSPLNILVASTLPPVFAKAVFHWLCLLLTGAGMIALCRNLGFGISATILASCSVVFSGLWIGSQQNLTISGALAWVPWALWAMERWLKNPRQFLPLAITATLLIFAGYPQVLHGVVLYMAASMVSLLWSKDERTKLALNWRAYIGYGLLAVCICIGLSAVQTLPLFELVGYSQRSTVVELWNIQSENLFRGMLFSPIIEKVRPPHFWLLGSILVCVLASVIFLTRPQARIFGHCVATFILFNLGMGNESLLFSFALEHKLIPGLEYFRVTWPYFATAIVGLGLIAASVVDRLPQIAFNKNSVLCGLLVLAIAWGYALYQLHHSSMPVLHYAILVLALILSIMALAFSRRRLMAPLLVGVVVLEIALIKMNSFVFYDKALLDQPSTVSYLKERGDLQNYKVHDVTFRGGYVVMPPRHPKLVEYFLGMMAGVVPSSNLLWDISAFGGAHALPQSRRMLIETVVQEEIDSSSKSREGLRLIDFLAMRYITALDVPAGAAMKQLHRDEASGVHLIENTAALKRFQTYSTHQIVEDQEEALIVIQSLDSPRLIVEKNNDHIQTSDRLPTKLDSAGTAVLDYSVVEASSTEYKIQITASDEGWFFIADANYPGWHAWLDGQQIPVYSAQILGKAVLIPPGEHELELKFSSATFRYGLLISVLTAILLAAGFAFRRVLYFAARRTRD